METRNSNQANQSYAQQNWRQDEGEYNREQDYGQRMNQGRNYTGSSGNQDYPESYGNTGNVSREYDRGRRNYGNQSFRDQDMRDEYRGGNYRNTDYGYGERMGREGQDYRYGNINRSGRSYQGDNDRDWWDRASDEVSSWFGDEEAERRRRMDKINGPHRGKGPKGYTRSDARLCEDINDRLYHDPFVDASEIEVTVNNGEAVLTGTVDSREAKRRAEDIAESVTGIKDVENHLKVNRTETTISNTASRENGNNDSSRKKNTWL